MITKEKFLAKVQKGCWLWRGAKNGDGYGSMSVNGKHMLAHRFSYMLYNGAIPRGFCVLHSCDTPACVNPEHLRLGTHQENMAEMYAKNRRFATKGAGHWNAKLTISEVREMRALAATGAFKKMDIGRMYGVTRSNIYAVLNNHNWKED